MRVKVLANEAPNETVWESSTKRFVDKVAFLEFVPGTPSPNDLDLTTYRVKRIAFTSDTVLVFVEVVFVEVANAPE